MKTNDSPSTPPSATDTAVMIAVLLDRDPVMAGQIKQYISEPRLVELLGLQTVSAPKQPETPELPGIPPVKRGNFVQRVFRGIRKTT